MPMCKVSLLCLSATNLTADSHLSFSFNRTVIALSHAIILCSPPVRDAFKPIMATCTNMASKPGVTN